MELLRYFPGQIFFLIFLGYECPHIPHSPGLTFYQHCYRWVTWTICYQLVSLYNFEMYKILQSKKLCRALEFVLDWVTGNESRIVLLS